MNLKFTLSLFISIGLAYVLTSCSAPEFTSEKSEVSNSQKSSCGATPYTIEYIGTKGTIDAELSSSAIQKLRYLAQQNESSLTDRSLSIELQIKFQKSAASQFAETTYKNVAKTHFCRLYERFPDKKSAIKEEEKKFIRLLSDIFIPQLYAGSFQDVKKSMQSVVDSYKDTPPTITSKEKILPNDNFTERSSIEIVVKTEASHLGKISACLGTAFSNLSPIDERTLIGLETLDDDIESFLKGGEETLLAVENLIIVPKNIALSPPMNTKTVTLDDMVCIKDITDEVLEEIKISSIAHN